MKKVKKAAKKGGKEKLGLINLKVTSSLRKKLSIKAKKYADGNLSKWLRHAGLNYTPDTKAKV
jgi:hypothetical protein